MPDRYDPKLSLRPGGNRRAAEPRGSAADDPLAELAKIVSGRSAGSAHATRSRPAAPDQGAASSGGDVLGDLETELLNDLQASFAAVRDMVASPPPEPLAPQSTATPESDASSPPFGEIEMHDSDLPPAGLAARLAPEPPAPLFPSSGIGRIQETEPVDDHAATDVQPPGRAERAVRPEPPTRAATGDGGLLSSRHRASEAVPDGDSTLPARLPRSRWEQEPAKPVSSAISRFAPPRAPPPAKPTVVDDDDPFADLEGVEDEEALEEFPLEGFGELHADDDDADPDALDAAYADGDLASMVEPRRSRTPLLVAGVIGLVLVGGIAVAMFRPVGEDAGTPPVIVADGLPTKITPDETMLAEADAQNKLIYDRVNPGEENGETTLLTPADEPIAEVPSSTARDNAISRVIIPGGPGFDEPALDDGLSLDGQPSTMPADDTTQMAAADDEPIEAIGPRRVRTVVVKPDGTIVESVASEVDGATADAPPPAAPAPVVEAPPAVEPPPPAAVADDTAAIAGNGNGELAITPVPEIGGGSSVAETPQAPAPEPEPPAVAAAPPAPAAVAAVESTAPIDLGQSPPPPSGGMLVQISSQRTEDAARATYRDLQTRYPGILGSYDVNIQRAEIPDRGTFYRVRVGPFSASDAQRLCNDLKAAGGDCILAQR
jgi:hypothetical protein